MFKRSLFIAIAVFSLSIITPVTGNAQCSMCTVNAEQSTKNGNTQGKGLNDGIVYLLALPYLLIGGIGVIWYRNYRKKLEKNL